MSKAIVNALAIAAFEHGVVVNFEDAKAFAEAFVAENEDLFEPSVVVTGRGVTASASMPHGRGGVGPIPKCPNCHEPINDHLPNCARATGVDPRAVTAVHHLRVDGPPPQE